MGDEVGLKVFVSWSGKRAHAMALVVQKWLSAMIQMSDPWLSSESLRAGSGWRRRLEDSLRVTSTGILCITPANQTSPWLLFEAGSLSKNEDEAVCPLLVPGMAKSELREPLSSFQATSADNKDEVLKLARTINLRLPEKGGRLSDEKLRYAFEREWPAFEASMRDAAAVAETEVKARSEPDKQEEMMTLLRGIEREVAHLRSGLPDWSREAAGFAPTNPALPRVFRRSGAAKLANELLDAPLSETELNWLMMKMDKARIHRADADEAFLAALDEVRDMRTDQAIRREERSLENTDK